MKNLSKIRVKGPLHNAFSLILILVLFVSQFASIGVANAQVVSYDNYIGLGEYSDGPEMVDCTFQFQNGSQLDFHEFSGPPLFYPLGQGVIVSYQCSTAFNTPFWEQLYTCNVGDNFSNGTCTAPSGGGPSNPVPTFTTQLVANPTVLTTGATSTLTWATSNATTCTASGGWSGSQATSGSAVVGPISSDTAYTLVCSGVGGTATSTVTITYDSGAGGPSNPAPTFTTSLTANPTTLTGSQTSTLTWATSNATTCIASGGWSGSQATSGSAVVGPILSDTPYTLTCTGPGGTTSSSANVVYNAGGGPSNPAPTFSTPLTGNPSVLTPGATSTLSWNTTNATTCSASSVPVDSNWSGAQLPNGNITVGPITATTTYSIICSGPGGNTTSSVVIGYNPNLSTPNQSPLNLVITGPSTGTTNTSYSFSAVATDPEGGLLSYGFDWENDGVIDVTNPSVPSGVSTSASVSYPSNGARTIRVVATDTLGSSVQSTHLITISGGSISGSVIVAPTSGLSTSENGSTASFTVVLGSLPISSVIIPVSSSNTSEGTVSVSSLTFTPSNWNVPQTVVVTGIDDAIVDGNVAYSVVLSLTSSPDLNYNSIDPQDVSLVNFDNESGGGSLSASIPSFTINTPSITSGGTAILSWTSINATLCTASNSWSGNQTLSGTQTVGPFTTSSQIVLSFDLACGNTNGTTTSSVSLTVDPVSGGSSSGSSSGGSSLVPQSSSGGTPSGHHHPVAPDIMILLDNPSTVTPGTASGGVCKYTDFITQFMKKGIDNNPNEVMKLQYFLNTYEAIPTDVTGIFDDNTEQSVKTFQARYSDEVLAPWGTTTPTGIVYITTTRKINTIFCGANPNYNGNSYLKDINFGNVLENNVPTTTFNGDIGINSTTTAPSTNIAGLFGALFGPLGDFLKDIPIYAILIGIIMLIGSSYIVEGLILKDKKKDYLSTLMNGLGIFLIGTILNVLNTLSFMMNSPWFTTKVGLDSTWIIGLDTFNLILVVILSIYTLFITHRSSKDDFTFLK